MRINLNNSYQKKSVSFSKKYLRVTRLTVLLLMVAFMHASAKSAGQNISFAGRDVPLTKVFEEIKKQTGYVFFYKAEDLEKSIPVTVDFKNTPLKTSLTELLKNQQLAFEIQGNTIFIKKKEPQETKVSISEVPTEHPPITITGHVTDSTGAPLVGASVINKKNKSAAQTNKEGNFSIAAEPGDIIIISYVGFKPREIKVTNDSKSFDVAMQMVEKETVEVVVTALGIKKTTKALTYNVQDLKGEEVTRVPDASFVNALAGKVAGVTINASSSGIGGSTRVIMRGDKSVFGNNNALYVLNGIPLPNLFSSGSNATSGGGKYFGRQETGDGISNINPEDIESIDVLTGASSAALYGSQAANGVVLINTKSGTKNATHINFSTNTNLYNPLVMPQFQNTYGTSVPGAFDSWSYTKLTKPSTYNPADYFQTGSNVGNSISLSTGSDHSQTYLSAASTNAKGIIPNNNYNRYNLTLHQSNQFLNDKLKLDLNLMYINTENKNAISQGVYGNPIVPLYLFPRSDDMRKYQAFERYDLLRNFDLQYWTPNYQYGQDNVENPFWVMNRESFIAKKERYMLGAGLSYQALKWLDIEARIRVDANHTKTVSKNNASTNLLFTNGSANGFYGVGDEATRQTYTDFLLKTHNTFKGFTLNGVLGSSLTNTSNDATSTSGGLGSIANLFSMNNVVNGISSENGYYDQTQAVFGSAELSYKNKLFLNVTGRNEWSSALANTNHLSFFYPSIGLSAILSDMVSLPKNIISYLKVRGSYSEVGNTLPRFVTELSFPVSPAGFNPNANLPLTSLQPERTHSLEVGVNSKFFKNRISLDVTLYNTNTFNQFFTFTAPPGSGISNYYVNAGQVNNKGIEARLAANIHIGSVQWTPSLVFTLNRNKVIEVVKNKQNPLDGSIINANEYPLGSPNPQVQVGKPIGELYVTGVARDSKGYFVVDQSGGVGPNEKLVLDPNTYIDAGNTSPKYNMGFRNGLTYKNFNVNFLFDFRYGGVVESYTQSELDNVGLSIASAQARDNGGAIVNGQKMDPKVFYTTIGSGSAMAFYVYSATNVRLREASVSYTIPHKLMGPLSITVSLIGRNLWMIYNKAPFDPELTASTGTYYQGVDYFMLPSLRSYGFSIKVGL